MLKRLSAKERLDALLEQFEPQIREAFLLAVQDLRSGIAIKVLVERLERRDVEGALNALNLDKAVYGQLDEAIRATFTGGGRATVEAMPALRDPNGAQVRLRFDGQAWRAMEWAQQHALAPRMVEIDKEAARAVIVDGLAHGRGARRVALDLAGRIDRASGRRTGGVIGLSTPQAEYVTSMRERLASGDPDEMRKVLGMTRRDKRFDRTIIKAMEAGKPVTAEAVERMAARYADRLLELRGATIARTEAMTAFTEGQMEAYRQGIDKALIQESDLRKVWVAIPDNRVRDPHRALHRTDVGFNEMFTSNGEQMRYPHDPNASAANRVNCRCRLDISVDFLARFRRRG